ncbi:hypothetical protein ACSDQ9_11760 [Aestuariimicrobium soli]|uniref:hypothetical protein n=1 Tax=Aestuariimicrobium soli TaxID=2035834 RepID=UPI003EBA87DC
MPDGTLVGSADLLSLGWSRRSIERGLRDGRLVRARRGRYLLTPDDARLDPRKLVWANLPEIGPGTVFSHLSAAVMWGIPLWRLNHGRRVWVTRADSTRGNIRGPVHAHNCPWSPAEVTELDGVPLTTMTRTAVDLGRAFGADVGIVACDWVRRQGVSAEELNEVLARHRRRPGVVAARLAATQASPLAESPAESVSRLRMFQLGLPRPAEQVEVRTPWGQLVGRGDFGWEEERLLGECDGRTKYDHPDGGRASDAVVAERWRAARLASHGWALVRWMPDDLQRPETFRRTIEAALAEARRRAA